MQKQENESQPILELWSLLLLEHAWPVSVQYDFQSYRIPSHSLIKRHMYNCQTFTSIYLDAFLCTEALLCLSFLHLFPELKVTEKAVQFSLAQCLENLAPHQREGPRLLQLLLYAHVESVYAALCLNVHISMFCA